MSDHSTPVYLDEMQLASLRESLRVETSLHPSWPDLWNLQGLLHAYERDYDSARECFRRAVKRNASYWRAQWNLCWVGLLAEPSRPFRREPAETARALQPPRLLTIVHNLLQSRIPVAEHGPENPILGFAILAVHAARGDADAFRESLAALRSMDRQIDQLFEAAGLWADEGPDATRIAGLGRPELLNPGFCDLMRRAAHFESLSGREDEALRLFALAALLEGNRAAFLLEKAEILGRRSEDVLPLLKDALAARPDWFQTHLALGYELSVQGILHEALHHLERAVSLQPRYADVQYQYGLLLHAAGRNEEAIATMRKALERNPGYLVARIALANLLFEEKREAEAAPHYARVFAEGIETPSLAGRFGYSLHAAGSRNHAEELFLEAISQDRERPDLLCLYGMFLSETDRTFEARTVWTRALRCDPSPETRERLEALLAESQKAEDAR